MTLTRNKQLQRQKLNTGVLHCVQDDDLKTSNDKSKSNDNGKCNDNSEMRGSFAALRMTRVRGVRG
jgi:hypothetical protein